MVQRPQLPVQQLCLVTISFSEARVRSLTGSLEQSMLTGHAEQHKRLLGDGVQTCGGVYLLDSELEDIGEFANKGGTFWSGQSHIGVAHLAIHHACQGQHSLLLKAFLHHVCHSLLLPQLRKQQHRSFHRGRAEAQGVVCNTNRTAWSLLLGCVMQGVNDRMQQLDCICNCRSLRVMLVVAQ